MVKDWLIRTKNNHILGPVTKEKIKQLISNGSIKGDDEVCSGNGYWIFIREQDLVARFIFGDEKQGFNPVQEIDPVLSVETPIDVTEKIVTPIGGAAENEDGHPVDEFGNLMPDSEDLEYPDMGDMFDDDLGESQIEATLVDMNLSDLKGEIEASENLSPQEEEFTEEFDGERIPSEDDLAYPDMDDDIPEIPSAESEIQNQQAEAKSEVMSPDESHPSEEVKKKRRVPQKRTKPAVGIKRRQTIPKKRETQVKTRTAPEYKKSAFNKWALYIVALLLLVIVSLAMYFRKSVVKELIELGSINVMPKAHAQVANVAKKKSGLNSQV